MGSRSGIGFRLDFARRVRGVVARGLICCKTTWRITKSALSEETCGA